MKKAEIIECIMIANNHIKNHLNPRQAWEILESNGQPAYASESLQRKSLTYRNKETLTKIMIELTEAIYNQ
jgi:hypothetical protein